jgi:hypothetical protein
VCISTTSRDTNLFKATIQNGDQRRIVMANILNSEPRWIKINNCSLTDDEDSHTHTHQQQHTNNSSGTRTATVDQQHTNNSSGTRTATAWTILVDILENRNSLKKQNILHIHPQTIILITTVMF